MIKIKTKADLQILKESKQISRDFYQAIAKQFYELMQAFQEFDESDQSEDKFSLEEFGYLVILTTSDNIHELTSVGLPCGLVNSWPEYIDPVALEHGVAYNIAVMYDNEFMMFFWVDSNLYQQDELFHAFLSDYLGFQSMELEKQGDE